MLNARALADDHDQATTGLRFARPGLLAGDPGGNAMLTISAAEMIRSSGVGRERLRTWERRHGFPMPVRTANNVRRYDVADIRRVIAVSRAVERGVPLVAAIEQVRASCDATPSLASLGAALDHAPTPAIAISGPEPMTVVWANGSTLTAPQAPAIGSDPFDVAPGFGCAVKAAIRQLLIGDAEEVAVLTHTDWSGAVATPRRSIAWRIPPAVCDDAVVVLMQLPDAVDIDVIPAPAAAAEPASAPAADRCVAWAAAVRDACRVLQDEPGVGSAQRALSELVRGTGSLDALLAIGQRGQLRTATSVRGTMPAQVLNAEAASDLPRVIAGGEVHRLGEASPRLLGSPEDAEAVFVPIVAGGEALGAMVLFVSSDLGLPELAGELLVTLATTIGTVLQREHRATAAGQARAA
ncbi:MAG: MerR family transcriptional regulator [Patulibacter sp.]